MRKIILLPFLCAFSALADSPSKEFSGSYHLSRAPIADSPENLQPNTHLYLSFKGQPAQEMYDLMEGDPRFTECGLNHYVKSAGKMECSFYPTKKEYSCDFSININEGLIDSGGWC